MGRFRRKTVEAALAKEQGKQPPPSQRKHRFRKGKGGKNAHNTRGGIAVGDRKALTRYLQAYREGSFSVLRGFISRLLIDLGVKDTSSFHVAKTQLPNLTATQLRQPYLALPKTFSSSQRRVIHEICTDLGLYHVGIGPSRDDRFVAVSIYRDGLDQVPGMFDQWVEENQINRTLSHLRTLKPWAMHLDDSSSPESSSVVETTKRNLDAIHRLIDHPEDCLRDGIDVMDYSKWEHESLSDIVPPTVESQSWLLVDSPDKVRQCVDELTTNKPSELAFDLECYNKSKYIQATCLIQLASSNGQEYVIDPLAPGVWESVPLLAPLFADSSIVKIGHSIGGLDVVSLHRDFGIFVMNAFDTYEAAKRLRLTQVGLANVCEHYGLSTSQEYKALKKEYQTTDWTIRPLTDPMIQYGRYDVHYLVKLRRLMLRDLARAEMLEQDQRHAEDVLARRALADLRQRMDELEDGVLVPEQEQVTGSTNLLKDSHTTTKLTQTTEFDTAMLRKSSLLMRAITTSQRRCREIWKRSVEPPLKDNEFQALLLRCQAENDHWTKAQYDLYESLADWREQVARKEQCNSGYLCSLGFLALIAWKRPTNEAGLKRLSWNLPLVFQDHPIHQQAVFALVRQSRVQDGIAEQEDPDQLYPAYSTTALSNPSILSLLSPMGSFGWPITTTNKWWTLGSAMVGCSAILLYSSRTFLRSIARESKR
eukprot:Nitzschia sp. Nitz4//scaffold42_size132992//82037//84154//NITZ4_003406-RA/size132992-processed-gene-0.38-mRNA-1//-1//CDS//3329551739//7667//frame0